MIVLLPALTASMMVGIVALARWVVPTKPELRSEIDYFASSATATNETRKATTLERLHGWMLSFRGDDTAQFLADLAVVDRSERKHLVELLKGIGGVIFLIYMSLFLFGQRGLPSVLLALLAGAPLGYFLVEKELASQARKRRSEFDEALTAVLSLMAVSMAGGSGLNTAIANTLRLGDGWVVAAIRRSVDEANFRNETPWVALGRLGERFDIPTLIELSATLSLVGTSGARVAETLLVRSASARSQLLSEKKSIAIAKSSSMGLPVGLMMFAWVLFLAFSPVMNLLSS